MLKGVHHITALARDAARTFRFYTERLGLRSVLHRVHLGWDEFGQRMQDEGLVLHLGMGQLPSVPALDEAEVVVLEAARESRW